MTKQLGWESPPNMAIAEGAITPNPGISGVEIWSTSAGKKLVWNGTSWIGSMTLPSEALTTSNTNSSPPPAGIIKLFKKVLANRNMIAEVGPTGMDVTLQPGIWRQKISSWNPPGNLVTVPGVFGIGTAAVTGTVTARVVASTNLLTRMKRLGYVSSAPAGSLSGIRFTDAQFTTGNGTGLGGFFMSTRFAFTDAASVTGARAFVGMSSTTAAPTNVQPSTLINSIGVAQLSTDSSQLYLVYGGSVAQTAIALGTGFPPMNAAGAANGTPYDLTLFAPPSINGTVYYHLMRLDNSTEITGTITPATPGVQTPLSTTLMAYRAWRTNNATALAVGIDISNVYIETDF